MKVSIIVPIYNVEKYINKCVESILQQTYSDYELILVDDGSPDNCGAIIDSMAKHDGRIKVVHKANGGLASARNAGIDIASGEYICFIDSDDWIEKDYLEKPLSLGESEEADLVVCQYAQRTEGDSYVREQLDAPETESMTGIDAMGLFYKKQYVTMVVAWNKLYKRTLFDNLRYTEGMIHEDEAICAMIYYQAKKVIVTEEKLYNYRVDNAGSIMGENYSLKHLDMLKALEIRMAFYASKGLNDYYEKDSFKYLYKILLNIIDIQKAKNIPQKKDAIRELKKKYWDKYKESLGFSWSMKRKLGMSVFGILPKLYLLRYKK